MLVSPTQSNVDKLTFKIRNGESTSQIKSDVTTAYHLLALLSMGCEVVE